MNNDLWSMGMNGLNIGSARQNSDFYTRPAQSPNILPMEVHFDSTPDGQSIPTTANGERLSDDEIKYYMNEKAKAATTARSAMESQQQAMDFNRIEAAKARDWQKEMYGSRFQQTINDIKKAGLNPYILNAFSPGGFSGGSAAQIASNVFKSYSESKNRNINKKEPTGFDWMSALLPIIGGVIGAFASPALGAIGGALGQMGARALKNRKK